MATNPDVQGLLVFERLRDCPELGRPIPQDRRSRWQRYIASFQYALDEFDADLREVKRSHQLPNADNIQDLELLARRYGELGKRRGRGLETYRHYLGSLVSAFGGRGTRSDIQFALAAGVVADERADVVLEDDPATFSYTIEIQSWQSHPLSLINTLADFADAPVVSPAGPVRYRTGEASVRKHATEAQESGLSIDCGTASVRKQATETAVRINWEDGWGAWEFGDGHKFDISEPSSMAITDVSAGETTTVSDGEARTAASPLDVAGELSVGGNLRVRN